MKLHFVLTAVALALIAGMPAQARIGETEAQIEARYGKPIKPKAAPLDGDVFHSYIFSGMEISVDFGKTGNQSKSESFRKLTGDKFSDEELESIRSANSQGHTWKLSYDETDAIAWTLDDGSISMSYDRNYKSVMVISKEWKQAVLQQTTPLPANSKPLRGL